MVLSKSTLAGAMICIRCNVYLSCDNKYIGNAIGGMIIPCCDILCNKLNKAK